MNQQCVVNDFKCELCDAGYVGNITRHLFQRIEQRKSSAIGKHMSQCHGIRNSDIRLVLKVLKKCTGKLE